VPAFLLDVNVLVALAWPQHDAHDLVARWFARARGWATCPFTETGLVRILANPAFSPHALTAQDAHAVLERNIQLPGHEFWPADISFPEALGLSRRPLLGHQKVTDLYLLGLAIHRSGKLATLDQKLASGAQEGIELIQ
jgi:toxin-antitoxin system PIN domain toxin